MEPSPKSPLYKQPDTNSKDAALGLSLSGSILDVIHLVCSLDNSGFKIKFYDPV